MILGERNSYAPSVHVPPWSLATEDHHSAYPLSPNAVSADDYSLVSAALQRYLPSNTTENDVVSGDEFVSVDAHSCDHFRMFEFKVRKCTRGRSHDWTECPFAHPGEKARRRDPRKFHYSGTACPDFRRGSCRKGDACEYAHGVFECWLHPARYRTQPCKDGMACRRRVCFFAHSPDQLRVLSPRAESISSPVESPPMSPTVNEMVASFRQLQLNKVNSMPGSWVGGPISPRVGVTRPGYFSLPTTPTRVVGRAGIGYFDSFDEEEPVMERVESGRDLRAKMFEKLSKENPLDRVDEDPNPDVGWVSELVK